MSTADVDESVADESSSMLKVPESAGNGTLPLDDEDDELNNTETLAMSESDDDDDGGSSAKQHIESALSSKKQAFGNLIDSDSDTEPRSKKPNDESADATDSSDSESPATMQRRNKTILSDSGDDNDNIATKHVSKQKTGKTASDNDDKIKPTKKSRKKKTKPYDEESGSENGSKPQKKSRKKKPKKESANESSGSDDESKEDKKTRKMKQEEISDNESSSKQKSHKMKKTNSDGESDNETNATSGKAMFENLFDAESSEDENASAPSESDDDKHKPSKAPKVARPPKRTSAKAAEEDMMKTIQSESQRLLREQSVSVPYHRPKQHSLQTFLSRRTVIAPAQVQPDAKKAAASLKMTGDELEAYARLMEERALESQQFYKSDSSDDEQPEQEPLPETQDDDKAHANAADEIVERSADDQTPVETTSTIEVSESQPAKVLSAAISRLEQLKQRVAGSTQLGACPTLKGGQNMIIDLDSGDVVPDRRKTGPTELYERFLRHSAKAPTTRDGGTLRVESVAADGQINFELLALPPTHNEEVIQDSKPRSAFYKLKAELAEKLAKQRRQQIEGRQTDDKKIEEDEESENDEGDGSESEPDEEEELAKMDKVEEQDSDEENEEKVEGDDNADEDDDGDENLDDENENESDDEEDEADGPKSRKRIVMPVDSDDEGDKDDDSAKASSDQCDVDAMLNICATNPVRSYDDAPVEKVAQISGDGEFMTQNEAVSESQLADLCSGVFTTQKPAEPGADDEETASGVSQFPVEFNDDAAERRTGVRPTLDTSSDDENADEPRPKKVKKLRKKRIVKLSDDEDDDELPKSTANCLLDEVDASDESAADDNDVESEPVESDEALVEYDSEENEVQIVRQTKTEKRKRANAFIENEAELSESDWGSADEDEHALDQMVVEQGDADQFDEDKLQEEVARIHLRRLMDADAREVQAITDGLLPEEEELGAQRERQFKWKTLNDSSWAKDELGRNGEGAEGEEQRESDDENEEAWRKMRHEREQLLKDMDRTVASGADLQTSIAAIDSPNVSVSVNDVTRKRRINVIKSSSNTPQQMLDRNQTTFLIGNEKKAVRNSFLTRDDETLNRLANMIKSDPAEDCGGIGKISAGVSKSHRNFVFTTLSPAADKTGASGKRKSCAEAGEETPSDVVEQKPKRPKNAEAVFKKRLLDSLK